MSRTSGFELAGCAVVALLAIAAVFGFPGSHVARAADGAAVTATIVDKAGFDQAIAGYKGKVVVVDCWATWCVPCMKQFPQTLEMGRSLASKGVVVVTLNFDTVEGDRIPAKVTKFLTEKKSTGLNLVSRASLEDDAAEIFGITDAALPHYMIFGKDGKLARRLASTEESSVSHEALEKAVREVLSR